MNILHMALIEVYDIIISSRKTMPEIIQTVP